MAVSLAADSRADDLRKRIKFLDTQRKWCEARWLAGDATEVETQHVAALGLAVAGLGEELDDLLGEAPTVELHVGELLAYAVE